MGLFGQVVIMPECKETEARAVVQTVAEKYSCSFDDFEKRGSVNPDFIITELLPDECHYMERANGVAVFFNDGCIGYDSLAKAISMESGKVCLLLYMYDGDYWGYWLYENGNCIDAFNPVPDYFEEISEEKRDKSKGNAELIAKYFHVDKASIERYLVFWTDELRQQKAYEEDECGYGDDWQIADFMDKLGYPWPSDEE